MQPQTAKAVKMTHVECCNAVSPKTCGGFQTSGLTRYSHSREENLPSYCYRYGSWYDRAASKIMQWLTVLEKPYWDVLGVELIVRSEFISKHPCAAMDSLPPNVNFHPGSRARIDTSSAISVSGSFESTSLHFPVILKQAGVSSFSLQDVKDIMPDWACSPVHITSSFLRLISTPHVLTPALVESPEMVVLMS